MQLRQLRLNALALALALGAGCGHHDKDRDSPAPGSAGSGAPHAAVARDAGPPDAAPPDAPAVPPLDPAAASKLLGHCWMELAAEQPKLADCYADGASLSLVGTAGAVANGRDAVVAAKTAAVAPFKDLAIEPQLTLVSGHDVFQIVLVRATQRAPLASPVLNLPAGKRQTGILALVHFELDDKPVILRERWMFDPRTVQHQLAGKSDVRPAITQSYPDGFVVFARRDAAENENIFATNQLVDRRNRADAAAQADIAPDAVSAWNTDRADTTGTAAIADHDAALRKRGTDVSVRPVRVWTAGEITIAEEVRTETTAKTGATREVPVFEVIRWKDKKLSRAWVFENRPAE